MLGGMGRLAAIALSCVLPFVAVADDEVEMDGDKPAATATKDPAAAKKWLAAAKELVRKGDAATRAKKADEAKTHYDNAVTAYEKSIEAGDDPNVYFELATFEERVGRLDGAATHYRALVKAEGARADLVKRAQARFDDLTTKLGLVMIAAKPDGTVITINGEEVGKTPLAEPLVLMPGTYTISLAAEGHQPKDIEFKVEPGSESERTVELEPGKVVVKPVEPVEKPEPEPVVVAGPSKLPLYVGLGATGGFVLVATITGFVALGKHSTFEDKNASPTDRSDAKDSGKTFALVTDICLAGALVAGGFTAYWYFAKYKPAQRENASKTAVVPWVKPDAGGLVLAGSF